MIYEELRGGTQRCWNKFMDASYESWLEAALDIGLFQSASQATIQDGSPGFCFNATRIGPTLLKLPSGPTPWSAYYQPRPTTPNALLGAFLGPQYFFHVRS